MDIRIANTDHDIAACYPVMRALRPHINEAEFMARVRNQQSTGYRLAFVHTPQAVVSVAGFRISENLAWGKFLYVDDLVTHPDFRSQTHGATLLRWLKEEAAQHGCAQLHLDSGIQRKDAHRFYEREGMTLIGFHFASDVAKID